MSIDQNAPADFSDLLQPSDTFIHRHLGPSDQDIALMLRTIGLSSLEELVERTVPASIRLGRLLNLGQPRGENELLHQLKAIAGQNKLFRSFIGMGYHDCITPGVIRRNILENPGWYTQYTPYQAEISQGRLEALINFQTMISGLTGLPLANASLLDEGTAAAEAMAMCRSISGDDQRNTFFVASNVHPQTLAVVHTRARSLGIKVAVGEATSAGLGRASESDGPLIGVLLQYPASDGQIVDPAEIIQQAHNLGATVVVAADPLALTLMTPPGELGADIVIGSAQRFGVPMGFGGPHAAFMSTRSEHARKMPGRIIGVSRDSHGAPAYRLAIQTREQHIRREKATSNICTAQVLLAVIASMYAVYHGPDGLKRIARRVHAFARLLAAGLSKLGHKVHHARFFDTLRVTPAHGLTADMLRDSTRHRRVNFRYFDDGSVGIALDETTTLAEIETILLCFTAADRLPFTLESLAGEARVDAPSPIETRKSPFLTHPVFNRYHAEHELLRYIRRLESRDLSMTTSMIPLGSCTMKLNGTSEMTPITWESFAALHPFCPADQSAGYAKLLGDLEQWLAEITGFAKVSLQPNAGSQGEYAGLLAIRGWHESRGQGHRDVCLIPASAHGTNPASAVIAGFKVVGVDCDSNGNVDLPDLRAKVDQHREQLAALMVTYPSTHGVFEEDIKDICKIVHDHGGQVYMDGANMNAQVGLCRPGDIGADVCHLNLHKTFCIPHGGGGPGMGPIGVAEHLAPFLPASPLVPHSEEPGFVGPVSAAPYGSASILPIPWVYIALMGAAGLRKATQVAILNANYMARRLEGHYDILFKGKHGRVAHEFVMDVRPFEAAGVKAEDIAKRLMDYGFHAPTMSWPVPGTLMIEPTESESRAELDRFCDAMIRIRQEIRDIEEGRMDRNDNPLKNAPHTAASLLAPEWKHPYTREQAAYPAPWLKQHKFWPAVGRIDNPYGDRNLVCSCVPMSQYSL